MELRIQPEPPPREGEAISAALAARAGDADGHPAYRSRWRLAGLRERDYASARPRNRRGATRA